MKEYIHYRYNRIVYLLILTLFTTAPAKAQTERQKGIVREITHSAEDPVVPIEGVQVVVNGISSPKSDKTGKLAISVKRNEEGSFHIDDVRMPANRNYMLASPSKDKKIFLSPNELCITLITPEKKETVSKEFYNDLWRKYRRQGNQLIALRNELEDKQLEMDEQDAQYKVVTQQLDSVQHLLNLYFDEKNKDSYAQKLKEIAESLATTDYQSMDSIDKKIYNLKRAGEWESLSALLKDIMHGDAATYLQEGVQNKKNADAIAEAAAKDLDLRFQMMEEAINSFQMQHQNDSVSRYYKILTEAAPDNWAYMNLAGKFEQEYMANYSLAMQYHKAALDIAKEDSLKAMTYNNIGTIYVSLGEFQKALDIYKKSLEIQLNIYGERHPETANFYNNIGIVYHSLGKYNEALDIYKKAIEIQLNISGEKHPLIATLYNNVGMVYYSLGEYDEALEIYKMALNIRRNLYGEKHPDIAQSYSNIGDLYRIQANYQQALEMQQKALEIQIDIYGERHPDTANSYNNIGFVLFSMGDYGKALNTYKKALKIQLEIYGDKHPRTAIIYNNIGLANTSLGEFDKALEVHQKAIGIQLEIYGEKHPDTAKSYNNIGAVYTSLGELDKALGIFQKALEIQLEIYGEKHPDTAKSYNNIGLIYASLGELDKALEYYIKTLEAIIDKHGEKHPDAAIIYNNIGYIYYYQGDLPKALEYLEKSLYIFREFYEESNQYIQNLKITIKDINTKLSTINHPE